VELFTKISGKKFSTSDLAKVCQIKIRQPEEFFDFLVSIKLLERDKNNHYSNTFTSETYLNKNNKNSYFGTFFAFLTKMERWGKFAETI